ncbi:hypothetical protein Bca101_087698 [Brassica carinata]
MGMSQFYAGVYEVVDDPSLDSIISWSKSNKSFVIWDSKELVFRDAFATSCHSLSAIFVESEFGGFVRIEGFEHLEFGHEQYFVRGKPELMIKLCRKVASARIKKDIKAAKEAEKNGCVSKMHKDAHIMFNQIMRSLKKSSKKAKAKTPLETID